ncbi:MAG: UDP-N-acetylmuramate--L-alanine ligase [Phycisphaeraceae bacterium]|nr:UDP-N-acetylmuramate--L-alanine ligase [Phycisphaeraceae bacterium]
MLDLATTVPLPPSTTLSPALAPANPDAGDCAAPSTVPKPQAHTGVHGSLDVAKKHVYMVGIGGAGMSGLAQLLRTRGAEVSGSDTESSEATVALAAEGIAVGFSQRAEDLPPECQVLVTTAAAGESHPQRVEARRRGLPVLLYSEALGLCMNGRRGIAIAGTHGKSTTTAMLGCALADAGLDPSVIVGGACRQLGAGCLSPDVPTGTGFRLGAGAIPAGPHAGGPGLLVAEACEYNRSFHHLRPTVASIGNIEADHLDVYGTLDKVVEAFHAFAGLLPPAEEGGRLLIGHTDAHRREVTAGLACAVETIGFEPSADWVVGYEPATRRVTLSRRGGECVASWRNTLAGSHNAYNACVAMVLAHWQGAPFETLARSLAAFKGVDRRMQFLGVCRAADGGEVRVFDDYGHHPTEIDVTLRAFRESEAPEARGGRLVCVFQPHQHSRTRHLLDEFAASFKHADLVVVPKIYFVRDSEEDRQKVTAGDLVRKLHEMGRDAVHFDPFSAIVEYLRATCRGGDVVVVMGAGDVWKIGRDYLRGG